MKKLIVFFILITGLLVLISCNSKHEVPAAETISAPPVVETEQAPPEQNWQELLLSNNEISTEEDIEDIKAIIEIALERSSLDELQSYLETEAKKEKVPPSILFSLSLVYGRKGLIKEEYKTIEKLEEKVKKAPQIAFNLSLVYGRKETLKSQIDKAEAEALALLQGFISVTSEPTGAKVFLNGTLQGTTPFTTEGMEEESYSVEIRMEDYTSVSREASVKAGQTTKIAEELTLMQGSLEVNSNPAGATVLLDGEGIGVTPLGILEIETGTYKIEIIKKAYKNENLSIIIKPGENINIETTLKMKLYTDDNFVLVQGGTYLMGSTAGDVDEIPTHNTTVGTFYITKYEVTQMEYELVTGNNPSDKSKGIGANYPVNNVSWYDAVQYCNALSLYENLTPCYSENEGKTICNFKANGYRLPTEAEWEYAARGGNLSKGYIYSGGNNIGDVAWYTKNSEEKNHPVGQKQMNELGLHDMSGNVWEWCWDRYGNYPDVDQIFNTGPDTGSERVDRGGGRKEIEKNCRITDRYADPPSGKYNSLGFRIVRFNPE
ncbi:MAG: SUMF1/EgtB/PvdO family nonheme iron enzyme [Spirochaetota bacterium]|nr:SUMF1/EgtB/PvdO family nonheme iron enzyme [Spirochaetota bacterium]